MEVVGGGGKRHVALFLLVLFFTATCVRLLPKDQKKFVSDSTYAAEELSPVPGRLVIDGEIYKSECQCKPAEPASSDRCAPSEV